MKRKGTKNHSASNKVKNSDLLQVRNQLGLSMQILSLLTGLPLSDIRFWERYQSKGASYWGDRNAKQPPMPTYVIQAYMNLAEWVETGSVPDDVLVGRRVGPLVVTQFQGYQQEESNRSKPKRLWECRCFCGCSTHLVVTENDLLRLKASYGCISNRWEKILRQYQRIRKLRSRSLGEIRLLRGFRVFRARRIPRIALPPDSTWLESLNRRTCFACLRSVIRICRLKTH